MLIYISENLMYKTKQHGSTWVKDAAKTSGFQNCNCNKHWVVYKNPTPNVNSCFAADYHYFLGTLQNSKIALSWTFLCAKTHNEMESKTLNPSSIEATKLLILLKRYIFESFNLVQQTEPYKQTQIWPSFFFSFFLQ